MIEPMAFDDASQADGSGGKPLLRCAKFMSRDNIACGLGNSSEPLRLARIRPTGVEASPILCHSPAEALPSKRETVRAIERVGSTANDKLLLSAWDDGSFRYEYAVRLAVTVESLFQHAL